MTTSKTEDKARETRPLQRQRQPLVFKLKIDIQSLCHKVKDRIRDKGNDKDTNRVKGSKAEEKGPYYTPSRVQAVPDKIPTEVEREQDKKSKRDKDKTTTRDKTTTKHDKAGYKPRQDNIRQQQTTQRDNKRRPKSTKDKLTSVVAVVVVVVMVRLTKTSRS